MTAEAGGSFEASFRFLAATAFLSIAETAQSLGRRFTPVRYPEKERTHRNILVNIVPMESRAAAADGKALALGRGCAKQSGKIGQGNAQLTTVRKINPQGVFFETETLC